MESLFLLLYRFFARRRPVFWIVMVAVFGITGWMASRIEFEEDITRFFPDDKRVEKLNYIFQHSSFAEKVVVMVSMKDSADTPDPDSLVSMTQRLVPALEKNLAAYHPVISSQVDDHKVLEIFDIVRNNLPVLLTEDDYQHLDSISKPGEAKAVLQRNYQQLISPSGIALKKMIVNDPMGFSFLVLKKLRELQYDENFELYDNYIITRDHRHLIFFIQPEGSFNDTGKNIGLVTTLEETLETYEATNSKLMVSCFGATIVAVGNAKQVRFDTKLTLSMLGILLAVFIFWFFRKQRVIILILIPVVFGALFSLTCIYLIKGSVSTLALAAGSIILGIAVNYALHFMVHLRQHPDKEAVIKDLVYPMLLGSTTTVLAFFSLQFTNAAILRDVGLFAGFSLIGAALSSLVFLPQLLDATPYRENKLEKFFFMLRPPGAKWILVILVVTPVFFYFAQQVKFNSDMSGLNFMTEETKAAQQRLESINPASLHTVYVSAEGKTLQEALAKNERALPALDNLRESRAITRYHSVGSFLISDSLQQLRIDNWNRFWSTERKKNFLSAVHEEASLLKFSPVVVGNLDSMIERRYSLMDTTSFNLLEHTFFDNNIIDRPGRAAVVSLVNVLPEHKKDLYAAIDKTPAHAMDRQMLTQLFVEFVDDDFNFIVFFTSILVFVVLLISSGRIEITMITFMPMMITWIWILGIMGIFGIEFNIVNVMISTFIFGLGDDYSIFVMDGLQQEYRTGKKSLPAVRTSIFISTVTTICGLGVLIFAQHPALKSIASIAIIGIVCVFVMSQTIEPFLFNWLITNRTKRGIAPMTFFGIIITIITYTIFVSGSFLLTIVGLLLKLIPFGKKHTQLLLHRLISLWNRLILVSSINKINVEGRTKETFSTPKVIIANHTSFLDILMTTALHPKLILLTNQWVWNSPVFGGVVRLAGYYPVVEGAEESVEKLKKRVDEGYSIVVFPEGTRSPDGKIKRFHKGAFYIAEKLNLPILPLLIQGASDSIPKSTIYVIPHVITLKLLPDIMPEDTAFGTTYSEKAKNIGRYFRAEHQKLVSASTTPQRLYNTLIRNYIYKGPVLEWYARIKVKLENNYAFFDSIIPKNAAVLDLGCGYGFGCYMLQLLSDERKITGVDYDEEKIAVAQNGFSKTDRLNFIYADVTQVELPQHDVIMITDVLHYLMPEAQYALLSRCFDALAPGGKIIIRDGNADLQERHKGTRLTEFFSVKLLGFNKSVNHLNFVSGKAITAYAEEKGWSVTVVDQGKFTSNIIFVISKQHTNGTV